MNVSNHLIVLGSFRFHIFNFKITSDTPCWTERNARLKFECTDLTPHSCYSTPLLEMLQPLCVAPYDQHEHLLCLDWQVLWNGQYPPRGNRGIQTKGCYSQSGRQDRRLQTPKPHHVCLGDPGQAPGRESVWQRQRPQCQLHQQVQSVWSLCVFEYQLIATGTEWR